MRALVIIPTYNERENLPRLITELLSLPAPLEIVVVDDNSPDGTGRLADEWAAKSQRVQVLHRAGKLGLGTAYVAGFKHGLKMGVDYLLTMDADFSHQPHYITDLLARAPYADLIIGSRYVAGGRAVDSPLLRRLLSYGANLFAKTLLGLQARDCTAGFRCYRRALLESLPLDHIFSNGYSFLIELLFHIQRQGWQVAEVPIEFIDRREGVSKISRAEITRAIYTVLRLGAERFKRYHAPQGV